MTQADDGFSGTNQNRPAFQRMIADVRQGFINTILIKDLSRLGRNYLEVGNLAEVFLPEHGCELISLNEKLDDMMVFRNWFNEQHSKSTSNKVRAARRICAENGKYLGTYAPYGYMRDPDNRHRLIIDENTAPIVRNIFDMRASGMGFRAIAIRLNEGGIIPPREYYYRLQERKNPRKTNRLWSENTIKNILRNEVYIGHTVQCKSGTISYKNPKITGKPKDEWIRTEGTHEPLVDIELWDRTQSLSRRNYKPRRRNDGGLNLFAGLVYCADCGFKHRCQTERRKRKDGSVSGYVSYMCGTYAHNGKDACAIHGISEVALTGLVIDPIRTRALSVEYDTEPIIKAVLSAQKNKTISCQAAFQSELEAHKKQIEKLDLLIENLLADKINGIIPESLFERQIIKYERDRKGCLQSAEALEQRIGEIKIDAGNILSLSKLIKQYTEFETLDSELLFLLIDKIIVGETKIIDGSRVCEVEVIYNY